MRLNFTCDSCGREFIDAKVFEVSISEMEDESLGVVVVAKIICYRCKSRLIKELNKPSW